MDELGQIVKQMGIKSTAGIQEVSRESVSVAFLRTIVALQSDLTADEKALANAFIKGENADGYTVVLESASRKEVFEGCLLDVINELRG